MSDVRIMVCAECRRASCWYGMFYCDSARDADVISVARSVLQSERREHESYLSDAMYEDHNGHAPLAVES